MGVTPYAQWLRQPFQLEGTWYWSDAARCCPEPDMMYAQVLSPLNAEELAEMVNIPVASTPKPRTLELHNHPNGLDLQLVAAFVTRWETINSEYTAIHLSDGTLVNVTETSEEVLALLMKTN